LSKQSSKSDDAYVIFGGTFDPIHEGHVAGLKRLISKFSLVILAPTKRNPWKPESLTTLPLRVEMIRLVLAYENVPFHTSLTTTSRGVVLSDFEYEFAKDFVSYARHIRPGLVYWAVGEDLAQSISTWKDWLTQNVETEVIPIDIDIHATLVRTHQAPAHPALVDFIRQHHLYP